MEFSMEFFQEITLEVTLEVTPEVTLEFFHEASLVTSRGTQLLWSLSV